MKGSEKLKTDIRVVGIGASAGGLEALQEFFKNVPIDSGMAYVVVQHLSPDYKSLMNELLARYTEMPIKIIIDGIKIQPNTIFLIPPRKNLKIFKNQLFLSEIDSAKGLNLPIDTFFKSLAEDRGKDAIGIILSGTGSDGTLGTRAIKEVNGMIMAQDEQTAKFTGMPNSSVSTGLVDYILRPARMPEEIINYIKHPFVKKNRFSETESLENLDTLAKILLILRDFFGTDFSYYKENTIIRRIERRISINRFNNMEEYLNFLIDSDKEKEILSRELLIGVTHFFRDKDAFESLENNVLEKLISSNKKQLRIWSAGCSTGEEVYSIAILCMELIEKYRFLGEIKIFATDIDRHALDIASQGFYPDSIIAEVDTRLLQKYFTKKENGYKVNEVIRNLVVFASHNLLKDPPFSKLDLLVCRNLFIYLKPDIQARLLASFYYSISPNGYLFMGSSETIGGMSDAFNIIDAKSKIYKFKEGYQAPLSGEILLRETLPRTTENSLVNLRRKKNGVTPEQLLDAVVNSFLPPSIVVDSNYMVVNVINNINDFTEIQRGSYSRELFSILPKDLGLFVNNLLRQLKKDSKHVVFRNITGLESIKNRNLKIEGRTLDFDKTIFYLITFELIENIVGENLNKDAAVFNLEAEQTNRIVDLEKQLQITKENLNATVEELETSNEELQSSNEELVASNEELQSTNEELQSVNEELYTVNSEYQSKIDQLTRLNNDINNLLRNTEIAALYLDTKLSIRKITPFLTKITSIMDTDIGRPITHFTVMNSYPELVEDVRKVLENLQPIDKEVRDFDGKVYFAKLRPYRTEDNAVDGIIITFFDITKIKKLEAAVSISNERLVRSMNLAKMAWWEWDLITNKVIFDERKATMLGYSIEEFPTDVYEMCNLIHPDDYERTMQAMRDYLIGNTDLWDIIYRMRTKNGDYLWYQDTGRIKETDDNGKITKLVGSVINITDEILVKKDLERNNRLFNLVLENSPDAITIVDKSGIISYCNKKAQEMFGISCEEIHNRTFDSSKWKITDLKGMPISSDNLPFAVISKTKMEIHDFRHYVDIPGRGKKLLSIDGSPLIDNEGELDGAIFNLKVVNNEE